MSDSSGSVHPEELAVLAPLHFTPAGTCGAADELSVSAPQPAASDIAHTAAIVVAKNLGVRR